MEAQVEASTGGSIHSKMSTSDVLVIETILSELSLPAAVERFTEKIDEKVAAMLNDKELIRLGVAMIGDRACFRQLCHQHCGDVCGTGLISTQSEGCEGSSSGLQLSLSVALMERALLFNSRGSRVRQSQTRNKKERKRTWTATFVCFADRLPAKVPSATKGRVLQKAGLGIKKIKFEIDSDEKAVLDMITSSEINSKTGQTIGFSKLKECEGFELMTCVANCRNLNTLHCAWSVKSLKANIGGQSRIYVRPIQKDFSTTPCLSEDTPCEIKDKCTVCGQDVLVQNLRTHVYVCSEAAIIGRFRR